MFAIVQRNLFQGRLAGPGMNVSVASLWIRDSVCHESCDTCSGLSEKSCLTCADPTLTPINGTCFTPIVSPPLVPQFAESISSSDQHSMRLAVGLAVGLGGGAIVIVLVALFARRNTASAEGDYSVQTIESHVDNRIAELDIYITPPQAELTMDELFNHRLMSSPTSFSPVSMHNSNDSIPYFFEPNDLSTPRSGGVLLRTPTEYGVQVNLYSRASSAPSPSPSGVSIITL